MTILRHAERYSAPRWVSLRHARALLLYKLETWCDAYPMSKSNQTTFVPIRRAASILGVPIAWLQAEVTAGRIPAIKAGRRWLVHLERTRIKLAEYAEEDGGAK